MVITYCKRYTGIPWYTHNMCHCTTKIPLPNCAKGKDADRARPGRGSLEYPTWERDHLEAFGFETSITYQKICPALRHVRENGRTDQREDIHASDSCPVLRSLRKRYFKILTAE